MAARRGRAPRCTPGRRGRSKRRRAAAPRAGPGPARGPFSPPPPPNPHRAGPGAQRGGTRAVPGTLLRVPSRVSPLPGQARAGLGPGLGPGASGFQRRPFPSWACGAQAVLSPTLLPSTLPRLRGLWLSPPPPTHTHRRHGSRPWAPPGLRWAAGRPPGRHQLPLPEAAAIHPGACWHKGIEELHQRHEAQPSAGWENGSSSPHAFTSPAPAAKHNFGVFSPHIPPPGSPSPQSQGYGETTHPSVRRCGAGQALGLDIKTKRCTLGAVVSAITPPC